jgi:hypothetical protein
LRLVRDFDLAEDPEHRASRVWELVPEGNLLDVARKFESLRLSLINYGLMLFDPRFSIPPNSRSYLLFDQQQKAKQTLTVALVFTLNELINYNTEVATRRFHLSLTN